MFQLPPSPRPHRNLWQVDGFTFEFKYFRLRLLTLTIGMNTRLLTYPPQVGTTTCDCANVFLLSLCNCSLPFSYCVCYLLACWLTWRYPHRTSAMPHSNQRVLLRASDVNHGPNSTESRYPADIAVLTACCLPAWMATDCF